jgi:hypothetical protein
MIKTTLLMIKELLNMRKKMYLINIAIVGLTLRTK